MSPLAQQRVDNGVERRAEIDALKSLLRHGREKAAQVGIVRAADRRRYEGGDPRALVEARGMKQVTDTGAIEKAIDEIIAANPDKAAGVAEKPQSLGWFVGQVMKATGGKANPAAVNDILKAKLGL